MRLVCAVLAAALLFSTGAQARSLLNPQWGTIFQASQAVQLAHQCSRAGPSPISGTWQPTFQQIAALEPKLSDLLTSQLTPYAKGRFTAANYYRQYGGLVVNGRQIIYVNGFHRDLVMTTPDANWLTRAVLICDGGVIAFGVEYDPATGTLSHFAFNGHL